jgi:hypothetical protein
MTDEPIEAKKPRRVELTERDLQTLCFIGEGSPYRFGKNLR